MLKNLRSLPSSLFPRILLLTGIVALAWPALAADVIYKYIDDDGVPNFTEQWQLIPERYHGRVLALDPVTLQPVKTSPAAGAPPIPTAPAPAATPAAQPVQTPAASSWLDRFSRVTITLPSQYQMSVGLMTAILVAGVIVAMRFSSNPFFKVLGKLAIMLMIGGAVYAIYFSGVNERVSEITREPTQRTTSGKEILGGVQGTATQVKNVLGKTMDPVKGMIDKTKAATIGEASQTVTQANQSNQELERRLGEIDPAPTR